MSKRMNFGEAMTALMAGKKIRSSEWGNKQWYIHLNPQGRIVDEFDDSYSITSVSLGEKWELYNAPDNTEPEISLGRYFNKLLETPEVEELVRQTVLEVLADIDGALEKKSIPDTVAPDEC